MKGLPPVLANSGLDPGAPLTPEGELVQLVNSGPGIPEKRPRPAHPPHVRRSLVRQCDRCLIVRHSLDLVCNWVVSHGNHSFVKHVRLATSIPRRRFFNNYHAFNELNDRPAHLAVITVTRLLDGRVRYR